MWVELVGGAGVVELSGGVVGVVELLGGAGTVRFPLSDDIVNSILYPFIFSPFSSFPPSFSPSRSGRVGRWGWSGGAVQGGLSVDTPFAAIWEGYPL